MTARHNSLDRDERLTAIDEVKTGMNRRYEDGGLSSLAVSAEDAKGVSEHFEKLMLSGDFD